MPANLTVGTATPSIRRPDSGADIRHYIVAYLRRAALGGRKHTERTKAAEHLDVLSRKLGRENGDFLSAGSYAGFEIALYRQMGGGRGLMLNGNYQYRTEMGESELGNITRLEKLAERIRNDKDIEENVLLSLNQQLADAQEESKKPFSNEVRLTQLQKRKVELDLALEIKDEPMDVLDGDDESNMGICQGYESQTVHVCEQETED